MKGGSTGDPEASNLIRRNRNYSLISLQNAFLELFVIIACLNSISGVIPAVTLRAINNNYNFKSLKNLLILHCCLSLIHIP